MLTVDEAIRKILRSVSPVAREFVPLVDGYGRILVESLSTPHDSPPFDKSMMDGFAVSSASFESGDVSSLDVRETITAGTVPSLSIAGGQASRIMTGAPIPDGADCVVPIEKVAYDEGRPELVGVKPQDVSPERNVLRQGYSAKAGEPLMSSGTKLEPQHIAVLAEFGVASVPVARRPTVSILATGDELLPIDQPLTPGRIRNSNEPMLISQIQRAGAIPRPLGVARDNVEDLRRSIREGLKSDFLILSGGVSAGTLDLVPSELSAAGVKEVFHKVRMKPGKPLWFGKLEDEDRQCWVFGLPGNPVSSMVCCELFVRTALRQFCAEQHVKPPYQTARLSDSMRIFGDREVFMPCRFENRDAELAVVPIKWGGSADLRSTAFATGVCRLLPDVGEYPVGEPVECLRWTN